MSISERQREIKRRRKRLKERKRELAREAMAAKSKKGK